MTDDTGACWRQGPNGPEAGGAHPPYRAYTKQ